jgi:hypothetical protein
MLEDEDGKEWATELSRNSRVTSTHYARHEKKDQKKNPCTYVFLIWTTISREASNSN